MDALDTAYHTGMTIEANHQIDPDMHFKESPIGSLDFEHTLTNWFALSYVLNGLNDGHRMLIHLRYPMLYWIN
jgi:hypothetical protein